MATNSGSFALQCPAWPGQDDTPGGGRDLTAELVEKAGTFQAFVQLPSAAELQPALLMADAHQPAAQYGVNRHGGLPRGWHSALLHSSLLLPDSNLGAPSHQAPSSYSFLGVNGQCPVDPLLLHPTCTFLRTALGDALVPGSHQPLHPSPLPTFKQSQHPPLQPTLLQKQRNTPALPSPAPFSASREASY